MEALRFSVYCLMLAVRSYGVVLFSWRFFEHAEIGCLVWAIVEAHAVALAAWNEATKESSDQSFAGLMIPAFYLAGAFISPVGNSSFPGQFALTCCGLLVFWVRINLGKSYSVAGSTWSGLCERGPYKWIRHPMLCGLMLSRLVVVAEFPTMQNAACASAFVVAMVVAIIIEEKFLISFADYRAYAERVRYRLVPLVW